MFSARRVARGNDMSERNVAALQAAVLSCLTDILSCEQQKIKTAEAELKALEVTEGEKEAREAFGYECLAILRRVWRSSSLSHRI